MQAQARICPVCYDDHSAIYACENDNLLEAIATRDAEIERLRAQVDEALGIQERNFGHGSDTHTELHSWAKRVREARGDG